MIPAGLRSPTPRRCFFNSYNQPSVNLDGTVVVRARSRGGWPMGPPIHGIYTRDMVTAGPIVSVLDRTTPVPAPNNLGATFVEWEGASDDMQTEGGYAKEVSDEEEERERQLLSDHIAMSDVVVTTALVPTYCADPGLDEVVDVERRDAQDPRSAPTP